MPSKKNEEPSPKSIVQQAFKRHKKTIQSGNPGHKTRLMEGILHRARKQLTVENLQDE